MIAETGKVQENPRIFPDVPPTHWARRYVEAMHDLGIVNGRPGGGYAPAESVTRAEFAKLLALTVHLQAGPVTPSPFVDVPEGEGRPFIDWDQVPDWAKPSVQALAIMGRISGFPDGGYHPNGQLQRGEAAKILAQFFVP